MTTYFDEINQCKNISCHNLLIIYIFHSAHTIHTQSHYWNLTSYNSDFISQGDFIVIAILFLMNLTFFGLYKFDYISQLGLYLSFLQSNGKFVIILHLICTITFLCFSYDMLVPLMTVMFLNRAFYMKSTPTFSLERTSCSCHFISYHFS